MSLKNRQPLIALHSEWLDTKDHMVENSIIVKNVNPKEINQYQAYCMFGMAGTIHKMWYGYTKPEKYRGEKGWEQAKYVEKMQKKKNNVSGL